jgi:hexulose-6-phosphate isomerase
MLVSINAWTFPPETDARTLAESAAEAGFEAIELTMGSEGFLTTTTSEDECRQIARIVQDAGLKVASLATSLFWQVNYGDADPAVRQQARQLTQAGLDRAAWLGTDALLVVPAVVGRWNEPAPRIAYADAMERTFDMLAQLREDAEDRGVHIALENVWNRFLLSPLEMRSLIDRVNNPWVGAYFDIGNAMAFGYPQDWIDVLGRRIVRVHAKDYDLARPGPDGFACGLEDGSVDWQAVMAALRAAGYDGPLTYEGPGEPRDIARRLRRILGRT